MIWRHCLFTHSQNQLLPPKCLFDRCIYFSNLLKCPVIWCIIIDKWKLHKCSKYLVSRYFESGSLYLTFFFWLSALCENVTSYKLTQTMVYGNSCQLFWCRSDHKGKIGFFFFAVDNARVILAGKSTPDDYINAVTVDVSNYHWWQN